MCLATAIACLPAAAQEVVNTRAGNWSATLDTAVTASDIRNSPDNTGTDAAVQVRPGLRWASRAGRLRGTADYGLGLIRHTGAGRFDTAHELRAQATLEAIENWFFVEAGATAGRTSLSAFGQQTATGSLQENRNRTDVATVSLAPTIRGSLGGLANYQVQSAARATNTRRSKEGDSTGVTNRATLSSASRNAIIGWDITATHDHSAFRTSRGVDNDSVIAGVTLRPDVEVRITLRGGQESSNIDSLQKGRHTSKGGELQWMPNERTNGQVSVDDRFFGRSYRLALSHRLASSALSYSSTKDINTTADPNALGRQLTLAELGNTIFASQFPDPLLRDQVVQAWLQGQDPNTLVTIGTPNLGPTLQYRSDLTWAYAGRRLNLMASATSSRSSRLAPPELDVDPNATRQTGYSGQASWRLTPTASLGLSGQRMMTKPTTTQPGTDLKSLAINWSDQLGRRTTGSLSARYSVFNSPTAAYRETGLTASLNMRF